MYCLLKRFDHVKLAVHNSGVVLLGVYKMSGKYPNPAQSAVGTVDPLRSNRGERIEKTDRGESNTHFMRLGKKICIMPTSSRLAEDPEIQF